MEEKLKEETKERGFKNQATYVIRLQRRQINKKRIKRRKKIEKRVLATATLASFLFYAQVGKKNLSDSGAWR